MEIMVMVNANTAKRLMLTADITTLGINTAALEVRVEDIPARIMTA